MNDFGADSPAHDDLERRLRVERPELSVGRLAGVRRSVARRSPASAAGRASSALAAGLLGVGVLLSGSGTALAVSGLAGDGSALRQQYDIPGPIVTSPTSSVAGTVTTGAPTLGGTPTGQSSPSTNSGPATTSNPGTTSSAPDTTSSDSGTTPGDAGTTPADQGAAKGVTTTGGTSGPAATTTAAVTQQVTATQGSGSLPFTGFAAIPVLLLGAALTLAGVLLRRRGRAVT